MDNRSKYENSIFRTNQGYLVKVKEYINSGNIIIEFLDTGYATSVTMQNLENGQIRNPFLKNKFGGYIGVGSYNGDKYDWLYRIWYNILMRTNGTEYYVRYHTYITDAYNSVNICDEWLNFNIFADWYMKYLSNLDQSIKYDVDKDLKSNFLHIPKMYSPINCILIPEDLNIKIRNMYNIDDIKYTAEKYFYMNRLTFDVYDIIMSIYNSVITTTEIDPMKAFSLK